MTQPHAQDEVLQALEEAAHVLPIQGPIEIFIHHNTLHAYQSLPFHEAIGRAEEELGVRGYHSEAEYRAFYREGRITAADVEWALDRGAPRPEAGELPVDTRALLRAMLFDTAPRMTRDVLEFLKAEGRWAAALDRSLDIEVRAQIVADTRAWLDEALRTSPDLRLFARRLVGPRVDLVADALERNGHAPPRAEAEAVRRVLSPLALSPDRAHLSKALRTRGEALAAHSLWGACVDLCGGSDVLGPATEDPVEHATAELLHPFLIPLCASFVDRGVARWTWPGRERGFFDAVCALYGTGRLPLPHWLDGLPERIRRARERGETAADLIRALPPTRRLAELKRLLLRLPGWGGMFQRLETFPVEELPNVRLIDFVGVRLLLEPFAHAEATHRTQGVHASRAIWVTDEVRALYAGAQRLGLSSRFLQGLPPESREALLRLTRRFDERTRRRVWQEAYERHHAVEIVGALRAHQAGPPEAPLPAASLQVVCCFDEREESYRRHMEEVLPGVRTYGAAGFFGVAIEFQPLDDVSSAPQAPLGVVPDHHVRETAHPEDAARAAARKSRRSLLGRWLSFWSRTTRSAAGGGLASLFVGPFALLELGLRVLSPRLVGGIEHGIVDALVPRVRTVLAADRVSDESRSVDGRFLGFTDAEKAQRVATTLENIGLTRDFAPLVVIVAHGSTSLNNPHESAHDCGACGGRNGGPNARLFARMANRPAVREALRQRGIDLPAGTHVLGALHDTASDHVTIYDADAVPSALQGELERVRALFAETSRRSAHERCRKFIAAQHLTSPGAALAHVEGRSMDLSQTWPELGHGTNAICLIGRRQLSRGLFLDRRCFLISYDPSRDPAGGVLERIMAAAAPVGAGISLEYYFSHVDNERLGCGTKLPHNLTAHVGVMNGPSSDLRTGLPKQMAEIHESVRLLLIVEAEVETLQGVVARQAGVRELALNEWVRVITVSPSGRGFFALQDGKFQPWDGATVQLPRVDSSRAWYHGHEGFRPPAQIASGGGSRAA